MKDQIKILLDAAQWRLYEANTEYNDDSDYNQIRCLEGLVNDLNEAYHTTCELEKE